MCKLQEQGENGTYTMCKKQVQGEIGTYTMCKSQVQGDLQTYTRCKQVEQGEKGVCRERKEQKKEEIGDQGGRNEPVTFILPSVCIIFAVNSENKLHLGITFKQA